MREHSPGPWRVIPETLGTVEDINGNPVGQADQCQPRARGNKRRRANARLMAAAPTLLDVLMTALEESGCDGDLCAHSWHEDARIVIANLTEEH